jgi:magnesium-transporting ATPase (P-type)
MFAHIFFLYHPEINKGGVFGYKYWSVFFASIMYPVLFFAFGYLLQRLAKAYIHDKKGKLFSKILISTLYFFSLFYFAITFFPYNNSFQRIGFSPGWYYIVAGISTIAIVLIINYIPNKVISITEQKLKRKIQILISLLLKNKEVINEEEILTTLEKIAE